MCFPTKFLASSSTASSLRLAGFARDIHLDDARRFYTFPGPNNRAEEILTLKTRNWDVPSVFPDRNLFFCFRLRRRYILRCVLLSTFRQLPADRRRRYPRDFGGAHVRRSMTKRSVAVRRRAREIVFFLGDSHTRPIRDRLYYIYIYVW